MNAYQKRKRTLAAVNKADLIVKLAQLTASIETTKNPMVLASLKTQKREIENYLGGLQELVKNGELQKALNG